MKIQFDREKHVRSILHQVEMEIRDLNENLKSVEDRYGMTRATQVKKLRKASEINRQGECEAPKKRPRHALLEGHE